MEVHRRCKAKSNLQLESLILTDCIYMRDKSFPLSGSASSNNHQNHPQCVVHDCEHRTALTS